MTILRVFVFRILEFQRVIHGIAFVLLWLCPLIRARIKSVTAQVLKPAGTFLEERRTRVDGFDTPTRTQAGVPRAVRGWDSLVDSYDPTMPPYMH
jgi:hypothetical protein